MKEGKVAACGPTADIMQRLDLLPEDERAEGGAVLDMSVGSHDQRYGMTVLTGPAGEIRVPMIDAAPGSPIRLRIRARDVILATQRPQGLSALNILAGKIGGLSSDRGPLVDVKIDCNGQTIVCAADPAIDPCARASGSDRTSLPSSKRSVSTGQTPCTAYVSIRDRDGTHLVRLPNRSGNQTGE